METINCESKGLKFSLNNTMKMMKQHIQDEVGISVHKVEVITSMNKDLLWCHGLLGTHTPDLLVNIGVFMIGLTCTLRAG